MSTNLDPRTLFLGGADGIDPCIAPRLTGTFHDGERVTTATAITEYLHQITFPAIIKGERAGRVVYNADHVLTLDENLFDEIVEASDFNDRQPIIVELASDGGTIRLGAVTPGEDITDIVRVSVYSTTARLGMRAAMRLYHFFLSSAGSFERLVKLDQGTQIFTDLIVNRMVPTETPSLVDDSGNRWTWSFRLRNQVTRR